MAVEHEDQYKTNKEGIRQNKEEYMEIKNTGSKNTNQGWNEEEKW